MARVSVETNPTRPITGYHQILENRTNTIITTNFEGKHLKELYKQSLVDRITKGNMKTNAFKN